MSAARDKVLIVDDQENNRLVIEDILRRKKYLIKQVESGEAALEVLMEWRPDCILMDQMMPGLSGIDTVIKIQEQEAWRNIPILMVTAKNEVETLKEALAAGAVDYITKPVDRTALIARVSAALRTKHAFDEIKELTSQLQSKNRELQNFTHMVSHDLKSPAASAASLFNFFMYRVREDFPALLEDTSLKEMLDRIPSSLQRMLNFVDTMLNYASAGKVVGNLEPKEMNPVVTQAIGNFEHFVQNGDALIEWQEDLPAVLMDPAKVEQVWQNLINNAIKYRGSRQPVTIKLGHREIDGFIEFFVHDNGPGISTEHAEKVFQPFERLNDEVEGSGVGLATVKQIVEAHGGTIRLDTTVQEGACFVFSIPKSS